MTRQTVISILLFAIIGVILGASGISIVEKPMSFAAIVLLVIGVEVNAKIKD